ncbi:MAG: hypothetical protein WC732_08985 [Candidatus Omnitrophota bacterium]
MLGNIFKNDYAGIYFGAKSAAFIQVSSGKIKSWLVQPYPVAEEVSGHASDDIFEVFKGREMEQIAFLQKGIRESKLEVTGNIVVSLPPKDLIIRFFEMPNIPHNEISAGINFEIKKYIPFKIEELAYDYQYKIKSRANIIEVILCGMKQAPLDGYTKLLQQASLTAQAYEPGLFSLFRLLVAKNKISSQKSYVILEFNKDGANILISERGFPYFTRDIRLVPGPGAGADEMDNQAFRLVNEVRVSLDYYRRQFLKKEVDEMILISHLSTGGLIDHFSKELGLKVSSLSLEELVPVPEAGKEMLPELAKAYGAALRVEKPSLITLNLAGQKDRQKLGGKSIMTSEGLQQLVLEFAAENKPALVKGVGLGFVILLIGYGMGFSKLFPLEKEKAMASVQMLPLLPGVDLSSLEGIQASETSLIGKEKTLRDLVEKKPVLYKRLLSLSRLIPRGVWITRLTFLEDKILSLSCYSYDPSDKMRAENMNVFVDNLKNDPEFGKSFDSIELKAWHEERQGQFTSIMFEVVCSSKTRVS